MTHGLYLYRGGARSSAPLYTGTKEQCKRHIDDLSPADRLQGWTIAPYDSGFVDQARRVPKRSLGPHWAGCRDLHSRHCRTITEGTFPMMKRFEFVRWILLRIRVRRPGYDMLVSAYNHLAHDYCTRASFIERGFFLPQQQESLNILQTALAEAFL